MKNFKKVLALVLSVVMVVGTMTMAFGQTIVPNELYSDVTAEFETAVAKLKAVGVLDGYADGTIRLENTLTRAEVAKTIVALLGLAEGVDVGFPNTTTFADVNGHWAAGWISIATGQGIIKGHADGKFHPDADVTEEQAIAMLIRALDWAPIVAGNYPYGENAKAMDLGLVKTSPIYGKKATRGYVFEAAAKALTAPMAERKATQGTITYEGEGNATLLETRLSFNRKDAVVVDKTARMEREYDKNEFHADRTTFVYDDAEFDATTILGEVVNVWYSYNEKTKENEVIFAEIDAVDSNRVEGTVTEVDKKDEIRVDGKTYAIAKDAVIYRENTIDKAPQLDDFVKLTLNNKSEVVFADAFDLTVTAEYNSNAFNLVVDVEKLEQTAKEDYIRFKDQNGDSRTIADEKVVVYKDGKIGTIEDIKELDLVKEIPFNKNKVTLVYAIEASQKGTIDKVDADAKAKKQEDADITILLGEEEIVINQKNFVIAGDTEGTPAEALGVEKVYNHKLADKLSGYVKAKDAKEVSIFVMPNGKASLLVAEIAARKVESALVYGLGREYNTIYATERAAIHFLTNEGGDPKEVIVNKFEKDHDPVLYSFNKIRGEHKDDTANNVKGYDNLRFDSAADRTVSIYTSAAPGVKDKYTLKEDKNKNLTTFNLGENGNAKVKSLKNYTLVTADKSYDVTNSTVFYNLIDDENDYEVKKYADLQGDLSEDVWVHVFTREADKGAGYRTPTADIVVVTKGTFKTKTDLLYGIVDRAYKSGDDFVYVIDNGVEVTSYVSDKKMEYAGKAIAFKLTNEKVGDLVKIKVEDKTQSGTLTNYGSGRYTIDGERYDRADKAVIDLPVYKDGEAYYVSYVLDEDNAKIKALTIISEDDVETGSRVGFKTFYGMTRDRNAILDNDDHYVLNASTLAFLEDNATQLRGQKVKVKTNSRGDITEVVGLDLDQKTTIVGRGYVLSGDVFVGGKATGSILADLTVEGTIFQEAKELELVNVKGKKVIVNAEGVNTLKLNAGTVIDNVTVNRKHKVEVDATSTVKELVVKATDSLVTVDGKINKLTVGNNVVVDVDGTGTIGEFTGNKVTIADTVTVTKVDTTDLTAQIKAAKALKEADYTVESWTAANLAAVIAAAEKADAKDAATHVANIKAAIAKLVKTADVTALTAVIADAKALKEADYTAASWTTADLTAVIAAAEAAGAADATAQIAKIEAAIAKLVKKADVTVLTKTITEAEAKTTVTGYTYGSMESLEAEIVVAKNVVAKANVTQKEVDEEVQTLKAAIANLVDITGLQAALDSMSKLDSDNYTFASWNNFKAEVTKAKAVLDNDNAKQTEVDKAVGALIAAEGNLVKR